MCLNQAPMIMASPVRDRAVTDIRATAALHNDIAGNLLAIHGLSGADTIAALHGVGKVTALKVARKGQFSLGAIGHIEASMDSAMSQAVAFMSAAYGKVVESCKSMTECRLQLWKLKTGKSGATSPKLCTLPPTNEAFSEKVKRCHLQVAIWKSPIDGSPPAIVPSAYGWEPDHQGVMIPRTVPTGTDLAPQYILKMIRCNCKRWGCHTASCSCSKIGCTIFCLCGGGESCRSPLTHGTND